MAFSRTRASGKVIWYASFVGPGGKLVQERVGTDKRQAEQRERARKREVADGTYRADHITGAVTLSAYADRWIRRRTTRSKADDEARLRLHVVPHLGAMRIDELRPVMIRDWVIRLRSAGKIAPKTLRNTYGVLRTMLRDAQIEELITSNPCVLPRDTLPSARERGTDPTRRAASCFTREEAETLISDERIPLDRRVWYALLVLTGMRHGEAAGRRWRDYDPEAKPLGSMTVSTQYNDRPLKTDTPRVVPVHATLASVLAQWKLAGFARCFGRHPSPDDFINPSRTDRCRSRRTSHRNLQEDCALVGVTSRRVHDTRHTFVSLARRDGARKDVLERVTHNAIGDIVDRYTTFDWEPLCEAVGCLRVELRRGQVIALPCLAQAGEGTSGVFKAHDAFHDAPAENTAKGDENQWRRRESNPAKALRENPSETRS